MHIGSELYWHIGIKIIQCRAVDATKKQEVPLLTAILLNKNFLTSNLFPVLPNLL